MAEGLLKQKLTGHLKKKVRVVSAGTEALEGFPATLRGFLPGGFVAPPFSAGHALAAEAQRSYLGHGTRSF
jgi:hypothetical protein